MAIETVKIPADLTIEERIIGPVSLRQIIILMIGAGISYVIWSTVSAAGGAGIVSTALSWIPALIAAAFAFVNISDISLFRMLFLLVERMDKPAVRTWQPRQGITIRFSVVPTKEKPTAMAEEHLATEKAQKRIRELSALLDTEKAEGEAQEEQETSVAETPEPRLPVEPRRVSVSTLERSIDAVSKTPVSLTNESNAVAPQKIVRDILPPS